MFIQNYKFKNRYKIQPNRLKNHDYGSNGYYFITICTKNKEHYFGKILDDKMILNDFGNIANKYWNEIHDHFPFVIVDEFVVMPNHVHGILGINKNNAINDDDNHNVFNVVEKRHCLFSNMNENDNMNENENTNNKITRFQNQGKGTISSIIGSYKSICTKTINKLGKGFFAWQTNYYDHVVVDEYELNIIRKYIINNPRKRTRDKNNR